MSGGAPDNQPQPSTTPKTWVELVWKIWVGVSPIATLFLSLYIAGLSNRSHEKIEQVETRQEEAVTRTEDVKKTVEETKKTTVKSEKAQSDATEVLLWATWLYLNDVAERTGLAADQKKAQEAKRAYDDFVKINQNKQP